MKKIFYSIITLALIVIMGSCNKDSLEPTLAQNNAVETSINTTQDLQGILYGAYNRLTSGYYYGRDFIIFGEVRSDNTFSNGNSGRFVTAAAMAVGESDAYPRDTWTVMYQAIASANIILGVDLASIDGDAAEISQIQGQAMAIRALVHFDLLKLYGQQHAGGTLGVPYVTTYKGEDLLPARNTVAENKVSIMNDLDGALSLMSASLNSESKEVISTFAVQALKSRVAVYFEDWPAAKTACEAVIGSGVYSIAEPADYAGTFAMDDASNSVFELAFSGTDNANINGLAYIYRGGSYGDIQVLDDLVTIFDEDDVRVAPDMIGYEDTKLRNLGKYPSADFSDNVSVIRFEEVILNYAEALFEINNADPEALVQLNKVPAKRNALPYTTISKDNILKERRRELCFEGFRFDDLARTHSDIPLVSPFQQTHGGPTYGSYNYAFPIPVSELNANSNMAQNDNY